MKMLSLCLIVSAVLFYNSPSYADDIADLKEEILRLQQRVEELESRQIPEQNYFPSPQVNRGWDPFEEMERMQQQMDEMFSHSFPGSRAFKSGPMMKTLTVGADFDLIEKDSSYEITFDLSGLDQEKLDVEVNEHSITIKGEQSRKEVEEGQNTYFQAESFGAFVKTIPLPVDADTQKMTSAKKDNTLVITLPKKPS